MNSLTSTQWVSESGGSFTEQHYIESTDCVPGPVIAAGPSELPTGTHRRQNTTVASGQFAVGQACPAPGGECRVQGHSRG